MTLKPLTMYTFFIKGFVIGLTIAVPIGPIGILCIQRSLQKGFKFGLMTGIGATLADSLYGLIASFGLASMSPFLVQYQSWIQFIGGLFLAYIGGKLLWSPVLLKSTNKSEESTWHALSTSFLLTLANPATILAFIAIFASLGTTPSDSMQSTSLILGVFLGSATWWLLLTTFVSCILHHHLKPSMLIFLNRLAGLIILCLGIYTLYILYMK